MMEIKHIEKVLAIVALLGGIARICMAPSAYIWGSNSMAELVCGFIACMLMGVGIIGVYLYQAPKSGLFGLLSVIIISFTSTLTAALVWNNMLGIAPEDHYYISTLLPINSLLTLLAQIVFGISALQSRTYPRWAIVLFMVYPAIYFIPKVSDLGSVAWGVCYVAFAWYMLQGWSRKVN